MEELVSYHLGQNLRLCVVNEIMREKNGVCSCIGSMNLLFSTGSDERYFAGKGQIVTCYFFTKDFKYRNNFLFFFLIPVNDAFCQEFTVSGFRNPGDCKHPG